MRFFAATSASDGSDGVRVYGAEQLRAARRGRYKGIGNITGISWDSGIRLLGSILQI
ncbi:MAG: hypothetical protein PHZ09_13825 [Eubacteriales bacterium]|nr:hypothetical protein [Eubacteriales bacterium]